jgi:hypothetical protein
MTLSHVLSHVVARYKHATARVVACLTSHGETRHATNRGALLCIGCYACACPARIARGKRCLARFETTFAHTQFSPPSRLTLKVNRHPPRPATLCTGVRGGDLSFSPARENKVSVPTFSGTSCTTSRAGTLAPFFRHTCGGGIAGRVQPLPPNE